MQVRIIRGHYVKDGGLLTARREAQTADISASIIRSDSSLTVFDPDAGELDRIGMAVEPA